MRTLKLIAVAIFALPGIPLVMAQQVNTQAQESSSATAAGSTQVDNSANGRINANAGSRQMQGSGGAATSTTANGGRENISASGSGQGSAEMRPVTGELEGKLDSKSAKTGDPVVLKTSQKMKTADGTVIPKGSRLIGHVTEVQAHEKGHAESHMGLEFDRAELKGGQGMAIHSIIESVVPGGSAMAEGSMGNEDAFSAPLGGGGAAVGGGGHAGGGGLLGGTSGGAAMATGQVGSSLGSAAGGAMQTTGNLSGEATGSVAHGVGSAASGAGSLGGRTTGIPGVMLSGEAAGSASGMLTAANRNIHLDSGTQMVLGIAAAQ